MTSLVDRQGRLFGRISLVDIFVILAVIALVILAFVRFSQPQAEAVPILTTVAIERVRDPTVVMMEEGTEVRDEGGAVLGRIERVEVNATPLDITRTIPQDATAPAPEDAVVMGDSRILKDVLMTIRGSGHVSGSTITVNGAVLAVGKPLVIFGGGLEVRTVVHHIRVGVD